jgi:hypothetical protein
MRVYAHPQRVLEMAAMTCAQSFPPVRAGASEHVWFGWTTRQIQRQLATRAWSITRRLVNSTVSMRVTLTALRKSTVRRPGTWFTVPRTCCPETEQRATLSVVSGEVSPVGATERVGRGRQLWRSGTVWHMAWPAGGAARWPNPVREDKEPASLVLRLMAEGRHSLVIHGAISCARIYRFAAEHLADVVADGGKGRRVSSCWPDRTRSAAASDLPPPRCTATRRRILLELAEGVQEQQGLVRSAHAVPGPLPQLRCALKPIHDRRS